MLFFLPGLLFCEHLLFFQAVFDSTLRFRSLHLKVSFAQLSGVDGIRLLSSLRGGGLLYLHFELIQAFRFDQIVWLSQLGNGCQLLVGSLQ